MAENTIAQAYVQILPTTEGIQGQLSEQLGGPAEESGRKSGESWTSGFGGMLKTGALAAARFAADAVVDIGKQAFEGFADYEQLSGGIETLFGDQAQAVMANASEAFRTAGMDANSYMEITIESAAAMINALEGDQARAAELSDMAITDMSDNANKMGTNMQSLQDAYRGFSRGNFSMLDNLALGFSGTREGMQELLDKARELSGVEYNIDSYADIVQAIHVVQTEMGITGTTAREASETIGGSVNAAKAAWSNLVTGLADENADIEGLVDDFVNSAVTAGENILPRIGVIMEGAGTLISEGAKTLIPILVDVLVENSPMLVENGVELIAALIVGIFQASPQLVAAAPEIVKAIIRGLVSAWPEIRNAGAEAVNEFGRAVVSLGSRAWDWGRDLVSSYVNGILDHFPLLRSAADGLAGIVNRRIHFSQPDEGPLKDFDEYAPDMVDLFASGLRERTPALHRQVEETFDFRAALQPAALLPTLSRGGSPVGGGSTQSLPRQLVVPIYVGREEAGRLVLDLWDEASARRGQILVGGVPA